MLQSLLCQALMVPKGGCIPTDFAILSFFLNPMLFNSRDEPDSTACELLACLGATFGYVEAVDKVQLLICTCSKIQHKQTGQNKQRLRNH